MAMLVAELLCAGGALGQRCRQKIAYLLSGTADIARSGLQYRFGICDPTGCAGTAYHQSCGCPPLEFPSVATGVRFRVRATSTAMTHWALQARWVVAYVADHRTHLIGETNRSGVIARKSWNDA